MKMYLLTRREDVSYDDAEGFVVAAKDEATARELAAAQCGDEGVGAWTDWNKSNCQELQPETHGTEEVILRAFNAG